ncbi:hypothetical protein B0H15DRAFT_809949 [Mycena belliarum]|uniref:Uncharacterized protein n=1 Tax=Mycena belliarum TaxID=1033014 RepID=A0AAD6Y0B6_9AGAR|nr:hypothetical protein B0H15DRAFT_809949 [Mycena belliae]
MQHISCPLLPPSAIPLTHFLPAFIYLYNLSCLTSCFHIQPCFLLCFSPSFQVPYKPQCLRSAFYRPPPPMCLLSSPPPKGASTGSLSVKSAPWFSAAPRWQGAGLEHVTSARGCLPDAFYTCQRRAGVAKWSFRGHCFSIMCPFPPTFHLLLSFPLLFLPCSNP